jgi:hypothetical protein
MNHQDRMGARSKARTGKARGSTSTLAAPPEQLVRHLCMGLRTSQALFVAVSLGIPDLLADGSRTSNELARGTQTHAPSLRRLMRALVALGVFVEMDGDRFSLARAGELLRTAVPGSQRSIVLLLAGPARWHCWSDLLRSVRSGEPAADRILGMPLFDYYALHPEESQIHDEAMAAFSSSVVTAFLAAYDLSPFRRAVDVGGGSGQLLAQLLCAYPQLSGVLFDLPNVVNQAGRTLTEAGVADRCSVHAGSFFETMPSGGDLYLLKNVLHDWDDERAEAILAKCREAMPGDATLLVLDRLLPERAEHGREADAHLIDLEMLTVAPGGRERTQSEMQALLEGTGFGVNSVFATASSLSIIEGRPA